MKKRNRYGKWICNVLRVIGIFLCFASIWGLIIMANKNSIVEWISNREWIFSVGITMMLIVISLLIGKRVEKDNVFIRIGSLISGFVYKSLNATLERIDNCSFILEGIEKEISETENKMEEYRLKAGGVS